MKHETLLPGQRPSQMGRREDQFGRSMHSEMYNAASEKGINDMDIVLINNTTGSARKDLEKTLYVPSRPHEARPYDHTGVVVEYGGQNGIELHLNDPSAAPRQIEPMIKLQSQHHLCLACTDAIDYFCRYRELRWTVGRRVAVQYSNVDTRSGTKIMRMTSNFPFPATLSTITIYGHSWRLPKSTNALSVRSYGVGYKPLIPAWNLSNSTNSGWNVHGLNGARTQKKIRFSS